MIVSKKCNISYIYIYTWLGNLIEILCNIVITISKHQLAEYQSNSVFQPPNLNIQQHPTIDFLFIKYIILDGILDSPSSIHRTNERTMHNYVAILYACFSMQWKLKFAYYMFLITLYVQIRVCVCVCVLTHLKIHTQTAYYVCVITDFGSLPFFANEEKGTTLLSVSRFCCIYLLSHA